MPNTSGITVVAPDDARSEIERDFQTATGRPRPSPRQRAKRQELGRDLVEPAERDWKNQDPEIFTRYYDQTELDFFAIVDDYLVQANVAAGQFRSSSQWNSRWRFWTIMATGLLAAINVCAALQILDVPIWSGVTRLPILLNAVAALYAGFLTVAGNLENFFNYAEQAAGFRESRDLLLSRYREYRFKWEHYVEAYGRTPTACLNAGRLYRELVDSDQELRQKLKQLSDVQGQKKAKPSSSGGDSA
jgi:hypothetical protein